ncbi:hypothetical protein Achl_4276 (plasmid) [Pseudarthrobacter chlorophenolicus A6]|uniref:Lipoprotein n=1 Tax=Pseudarthrobacter chlorophenolicus (strain ATCC 700700 / DSM 12829 / CIP 107037 / JCM 12360 / KCTC 9906 / NCIMB 13794 / A6) TaxID=452863 RepID=B8HII0_PSECP|nr:hypothetical protein [Pseudarthrobacter chlorophenolicus]ACL42227.1 hypothetical protein Achl_4276 [Pseudarthrobacter chlorophenolicus A6]SDQ15159.1 hypothetical protein SAMN04489738_0334 [Pseudarthrobacter chlorophenolicus]
MNTAGRTKTLVLSGLLAGLVLTGCSTSPTEVAAQKSPVAEPEAPKVKIADAPMIEGTDLFPTDVPKNQHFTPAEVADIKKTAVTALQIMLEEHPEYTVEGFKPTAETWNSQVAPKLQPISTPQGIQDMKKGWEKAPTGDKKIDANGPEKFFGNPILTNAPDLLDGDSYPTYGLTNTWKSDKGEVCSPSGKPYELNALGVTLSATYADGTYLDATAAGQVEVTVHCKEGGTLTTTVDQNVFLDHSGPGEKFFIGGASLLKTGGSTKAVLTK